MTYIPEDVVGHIYKIYFTHVVIKELNASQLQIVSPSIWKDPSDRLKEMVGYDCGAYQHRHTDLCEFVPDHEMDYFKNRLCLNCAEYNFPCTNCHYFLFDEQIPKKLFRYT